MPRQSTPNATSGAAARLLRVVVRRLQYVKNLIETPASGCLLHSDCPNLHLGRF
jgi:hypothetical protein